MVAGMLAAVSAAAVLAAGGGPMGARDCYWMRAEADFAPPTAFIPSEAKTYDMDLVPAASHIEVEQRGDEGGTTVALRVKGMKAGHKYGVHVHQKPCGAKPEDAGGHYQHRKDPVQPSKNPAYLNPENEVWLDFEADADGAATARSEHSWSFRRGEAASVVLHRAPGGAGDRLACFTVPFGSLPRA
ncbi:superoxide dismutase family protein [Streptomyces monticola]|uniref:Superoxide dismutase [Cu-Zn] n=1 Tax=Streptomyces monticola TaxID=2666263 RepID=A0ABW2JSE4_9ACTN